MEQRRNTDRDGLLWKYVRALCGVPVCQQNTFKAIAGHDAKPIKVDGIPSHYSSGLWIELTHEENESFEETVPQTSTTAGCHD